MNLLRSDKENLQHFCLWLNEIKSLNGLHDTMSTEIPETSEPINIPLILQS